MGAVVAMGKDGMGMGVECGMAVAWARPSSYGYVVRVFGVISLEYRMCRVGKWEPELEV